MKTPVFTGVCTALITPFSELGIDFCALKRLIDDQAVNGVSAIVLAGTTGENATLSRREYRDLIRRGVQYADGRLKIIAGIGGNDPAECLNKALYAQRAGADGVLMCTPYYNKTTQQGLVVHFYHVADGISLPLILYNVPSRTSIGAAAETYRILSLHPNINGVKEASGDFSLIARVCAECEDYLNIWSGNDDQTIPMMALGAKGVFSVVSNLLPKELSEIVSDCEAGDFQAARTEYGKIAELCRLLFLETNPIPVKAAMAHWNMDSGILRLPLIPMSEGNCAKLKNCLDGFFRDKNDPCSIGLHG